MLDVTRIAYLLIMGVMGLAVVAVCSVVSGTGGGDDGSLPEITTKQIVDYARFGMVEQIDVDGSNVTATFVESFDSEDAFGEESRRFRATLAEGESMTAQILAAGLTVGEGGIEINGEDAVQTPPDQQPSEPEQPEQAEPQP